MRSYRGYAAINMRQFDGWRTFHSLQMSMQRRFRDGVSFGFNDTWVLYDHASAGAAPAARCGRLVLVPRRSGARPTSMLAAVIPNKHIIKGNFVWDLPDLDASRRGAEGARPA